MNYLAILQKANTLSGLQGTISSISGLTGEQADLREFVDTTYYNIQVFRDEWTWMQEDIDISLTPLINSFSSALVKKYLSMRYEQKYLRFVSYEDYLKQDWTTSPSRPSKYTIVPETYELIFNTSDDDYTVKGRYVIQPDVMEAQSDTPMLPLAYHQMIAYGGAAELASSLGNMERADRNWNQYDNLMNALLRRSNPAKRMKVEPFVRI